jgi:hypothetical protein
MTVLTIRPSTESSNIGAIRNANATYATARAGSGTFTAFVTGSTTIPGGQRLNAGTYDLNEMFLEFPTGSAVPNAVVSDVKFEWTTASANVTGGLQQAILDYSAGNITTADWRDGTALSGLTSLGSIPGAGFQANSTTYQVSLNAAGIASAQTALRAGGSMSFMVVAQDQVNNIAPTVSNRYDIRSETDATAAFRPALIITYSEGIGVRLTRGKLARMRLVG